METLQILKFATFIITFLTSYAKADSLELSLYPTTNCFKDIPLLNGKVRKEVEGSADCSKLYPDKDSFCSKICMLRTTEMIQTQDIPPMNFQLEWKYEKIQAFNNTADAESIMVGLLVKYYDINITDFEELENDAKFREVGAAMEDRANKCKTLGFVIPRQQQTCRLFTPETKDQMEKLQNCIEEALKCKAESF